MNIRYPIYEGVYRILTKNGGRHVLFDLENSDIVNVEDI